MPQPSQNSADPFRLLRFPRNPNSWHSNRKTPSEDGVSENPGRSKSLCFGDLAALDAAGAYADALGRTVYQGLDGLQIHVPAPARHVVRVRDVVTKLRAFAANFANLCHNFAPNLVVFPAAAARGEYVIRFHRPVSASVFGPIG